MRGGGWVRDTGRRGLWADKKQRARVRVPPAVEQGHQQFRRGSKDQPKQLMLRSAGNCPEWGTEVQKPDFPWRLFFLPLTRVSSPRFPHSIAQFPKKTLILSPLPFVAYLFWPGGSTAEIRKRWSTNEPHRIIWNICPQHGWKKPAQGMAVFLSLFSWAYFTLLTLNWQGKPLPSFANTFSLYFLSRQGRARVTKKSNSLRYLLAILFYSLIHCSWKVT